MFGDMGNTYEGMISIQKEVLIMPWEERSTMDSRRLFVAEAVQEGANIRALCRSHGISPKTGYKLLGRFREQGFAGLGNQSRRPHTSPGQTSPDMEAQVLAAHVRKPTYGARKLQRWMQTHEGVPDAPPPGTIIAILRRHGAMAQPTVDPPDEILSFEHEAPNDLWQMDFMGHRPLQAGRVHLLTIIDDHSRFGVCLAACAHERGSLVQHHLSARFRDVGMPRAILTDNGPPWGVSGRRGISRLEAWLIQHDIEVKHGRPRHPQTQGKVERWHRTIAEAVFTASPFADLAAVQIALDAFRDDYNYERPHAALDLAVPASRYTSSLTPFPATPPPIVYDDGAIVRKVSSKGLISYLNNHIYVGEGIRGHPVMVTPSTTDGLFEVVFCRQQITTFDLRSR